MQVWPVIHVNPLDGNSVYANAAIAQSHGCAGVFLISHGMGDDSLIDLADMLQWRVPGLPVGINFLSKTPAEAIEAIKFPLGVHISALWSDVGFQDVSLQECEDSKVLLFSGVEFKGQPKCDDWHMPLELAVARGIPTTSGPATGVPPTNQKVQRLRAGLRYAGHKNTPLAVASGVTPKNIRSLQRAGATHVLVHTGIVNPTGGLFGVRLKALMQEVER